VLLDSRKEKQQNRSEREEPRNKPLPPPTDHRHNGENQVVAGLVPAESGAFDVVAGDEQPIALARENAATRARTRSFFTVTVLSQVLTGGTNKSRSRKTTQGFPLSRSTRYLRRYHIGKSTCPVKILIDSGGE
jgi:hypothetical protein